MEEKLEISKTNILYINNFLSENKTYINQYYRASIWKLFDTEIDWNFNYSGKQSTF